MDQKHSLRPLFVSVISVSYDNYFSEYAIRKPML
jgi:hypothetical protein